MSTSFYICILISYLLGAIPFGLLISRIHNIDIRSKGSGNIGATNVFRVISPTWGIITLFFDILKGFIPAYYFSSWFGVESSSFNIGVLFGLAAVLGHTFPIYLTFKGGKGVATSAGILLGIAPFAVGIGIMSWLFSMLISRYVSLSSIIASIVVAIVVWIQNPHSLLTNFLITILSGIIIWLHRANINRLLKGTENRFGKGRNKI